MEKIKLYGFITDADTGELLPGASIFESDQQGKPNGKGTTSDQAGKFELQTTKGHLLTASLIGYHAKKFNANAGKYYIQLQQKPANLPAVNITATKTNKAALAFFAFIALLFGIKERPSEKK